MSRILVAPGDVVHVRLPYSEVCMHMQVAGKEAWVERLTGRDARMAQLYVDGRPFSFPITCGEAGLYTAYRGDGTSVVSADTTTED